MRSKRVLGVLEIALLSYGGFCAVNWFITYYLGRTGSPTLLGSTALMNLHLTLSPYNIMAKLIDPLKVAQGMGASNAPPAPSSTGVPPLLALPTATERFSAADPNWMGL